MLILVTRAMLELDTLSMLRKSPAVGDLFKAIIHAVIALGVLTVAAFAALLLDTDAHPRVLVLYVVFVLFLIAAWKLLSAARLMWRVLAIETAGALAAGED